MNINDLIMLFGNSLAYLLDNPIASLFTVVSCYAIHLMLKSSQQKTEIKKLSEENVKLTSENIKLQAHAKIGESLITTVNAFKN
jgi:hypothetical protein